MWWILVGVTLKKWKFILTLGVFHTDVLLSPYDWCVFAALLNLERLNVKVIDPGQHTGLPSAEENDAITKAQKENIEFLQIPRRLVSSLSIRVRIKGSLQNVLYCF